MFREVEKQPSYRVVGHTGSSFLQVDPTQVAFLMTHDDTAQTRPVKYGEDARGQEQGTMCEDV
jgi:hypothetical protein